MSEGMEFKPLEAPKEEVERYSGLLSRLHQEASEYSHRVMAAVTEAMADRENGGVYTLRPKPCQTEPDEMRIGGDVVKAIEEGKVVRFAPADKVIELDRPVEGKDR